MSTKKLTIRLFLIGTVIASCTSDDMDMDEDTLEYNDIIGIWDMYSAEINGCEFFSDSSFEGIGNNCYQFAGNSLCRMLEWEFLDNNIFELRASDYYPDLDTIIVNASILNGILREALDGEFELCATDTMDCFSISLTTSEDTLTIEHYESCFFQMRLIPQ